MSIRHESTRALAALSSIDHGTWEEGDERCVDLAIGDHTARRVAREWRADSIERLKRGNAKSPFDATMNLAIVRSLDDRVDRTSQPAGARESLRLVAHREQVTPRARPRRRVEIPRYDQLTRPGDSSSGERLKNIGHELLEPALGVREEMNEALGRSTRDQTTAILEHQISQRDDVAMILFQPQCRTNIEGRAMRIDAWTGLNLGEMGNEPRCRAIE